MSEADKTYGKCPRCKNKTLLTGIWAERNPKMNDGKIACVDCRVTEIMETTVKAIREKHERASHQ